jgi:hypothetical protein
MTEVKLTSGEGDMKARVDKRLRNSGEGLPSDVHVVKGTGPTRTHTRVFHGGTAHGSTTKQRSDYEKGSR